MVDLSDLSIEKLNTLNKDALLIVVAALQSQLDSFKSQLESANAMLADNNRQIELLTEQIRIMNQRQFGKRSESVSEIDGQLSMFDSFNEVEATQDSSAPEPEITEVIISSYKRSKRKGKREADLDGLPARVFDHKLSEEELAKKFPNGYKELPEEVYKRLGEADPYELAQDRPCGCHYGRSDVRGIHPAFVRAGYILQQNDGCHQHDNNAGCRSRCVLRFGFPSESHYPR